MAAAEHTYDRLAYTHVAALWHAEFDTHRARAAEIGVQCPEPVFAQLFHAPRLDPTHLLVVGAIDWRGVRWCDAQLSGHALAEVHVHRALEAAVDNARDATASAGLDDTEAAAWSTSMTWSDPPILIDGDVSASPVSYELIVGATRLGRLLGLIDRGDLTADARHRVWVGRRR